MNMPGIKLPQINLEENKNSDPDKKFFRYVPLHNIKSECKIEQISDTESTIVLSVSEQSTLRSPRDKIQVKTHTHNKNKTKSKSKSKSPRSRHSSSESQHGVIVIKAHSSSLPKKSPSIDPHHQYNRGSDHSWAPLGYKSDQSLNQPRRYSHTDQLEKSKPVDIQSLINQLRRASDSDAYAKTNSDQLKNPPPNKLNELNESDESDESDKLNESNKLSESNKSNKMTKLSKMCASDSNIYTKPSLIRLKNPLPDKSNKLSEINSDHIICNMADENKYTIFMMRWDESDNCIEKNKYAVCDGIQNKIHSFDLVNQDYVGKFIFYDNVSGICISKGSVTNSTQVFIIYSKQWTNKLGDIFPVYIICSKFETTVSELIRVYPKLISQINSDIS